MPRKRKRETNEANQDESVIQPTEKIAKRVSSSRRPLRGQIVAISTSMEGTETLRQVADRCVSLGASVSGQVHSRLFCVIASASALVTASQKVRKGWKRGIPVVTTDWLYACDKVGQCLPLKDYRVLETSPKAAHRHMPIRVPEETNDVPISKENDQTVIKVDLGCCCACHDHDKASTQAQCEWCVDCNVNQIARVT